ncbi:3-hydroxyisobutyrate dehydrogenase [Pelistega indica]|uniref:3-hydroxyisobutyrate dehydrogenase n=1 Tax=Pelistega indica TaxID=1414851 RepID=V8G6N9_9BURK|nr:MULTISPECIES: NAD(P)-dependent oxidoreductase [Pelistega]ETD72204.1 3-hydroxyisobutyrate dehydrogenase [Pelistega indica]
MKVGVIGLGNMGLGMASHLQSKQVEVMGLDVSVTAQQRAKEKGIQIATSLDEIVNQNDYLILSLPKAGDVETVCLGAEGILSLARGKIYIIDTSTSTAEVSQKISRQAEEKSIAFIDAPVTGGPLGASSGTMTMFIGASDANFNAVLPLLKLMSAEQILVGEVGAGNIVKIANNLLVAMHLLTMSEAVHMAEKAGIKPEKLILGVNKGSGRSAVSQVNYEKWILNNAFDSGFTMGLMRKDVQLAKDLLTQLNLDLPVSNAAVSQWELSKNYLEDRQDFNKIVTLNSMMNKDKK